MQTWRKRLLCDNVYQIIQGGRRFGRGPLSEFSRFILENQAERKKVFYYSP